MPKAAADDDRFDLSPKDGAALIGVHADTLRRWAKAGVVRFWRTPGGQYRFCRADLLALLPDSDAAAG